jgi:hypothetical protein
LTKYEIWTGEGTAGGTQTAMFESTNSQARQMAIEDGLSFTWSFEAASWDSAMVIYHEYEGWEPYQPMK